VYKKFYRRALSSTEAEVIAGCAARKIVKYFRKVFTDLRFPLTRPTPVGEDNAGTILISNRNRPSGRTRHLDIQYFTSQEWVQRGLMKYFKICRTVNPAEAMSKALFRILFYQHFDRVQGYFGSPHLTHEKYLNNPNYNTPSWLIIDAPPAYYISHKLFGFWISYFLWLFHLSDNAASQPYLLRLCLIIGGGC
jgi:hypothetical protein